MINNLNIFLIDINDIDITETLNSIYNQTFSNWDLFILTNKNYSKLFNIISKNKCHIIKVTKEDFSFNALIFLTALIPGDYITFLNNGDTLEPERFEKQIAFMNSNNVNISSCLENIISDNIYEKNIINDSNNFITADSVNEAISASYVPLDLYTFILKKDFLYKIFPYAVYYFFTSELDLILYFLRFENISKIPEILYYAKDLRLPYNECLNYYDAPDTTNKLALFNQNKILDNQEYFNEIINSERKFLYSPLKFKYSVITIVNSTNIGGTESYIIELANKLKMKNIQLCILTNRCFNKELFIFHDIPLYIVNLNDKKNITDILKQISNIKLIQIHMEKDISLCPMLKSILDIPIILTIHGIYYSDKIINNFLPYIDEVIFVSEYSKEYYENLIPSLSSKKYEVIPNGIEISMHSCKKKISLRKLLNIPEDSIIFLYCSRLSFNKSKLAVLFLKSFKHIAHKYKNSYAVIVGNGNNASAVECLSLKINESFNNNRIFFLGNKFNISDYYLGSDIVVGTGRVALEAMSLGKPVISFGSNGTVNIVNSSNIDMLIKSNFGDHSFKAVKFDSKIIINKLIIYLNMLADSYILRRNIGLWNKSVVKKHLSLNKITQFYIDKCNEKNPR